MPVTVLPATPTAAATIASPIQVYFTNPESPTAKDYKDGPDKALAAEINQARLSVDVAAYSLNLWSIRDALIRAHRRGVEVRVVMESDNMDVAEVQDLLDAEIPIVGDRHEGLMHDKFVIIDRSVVWTGSMNFTTGGAYKDNNNLIRIPSPQVATDYTTRFEGMFTDDRFGPDAIANTPYPHPVVDNTRLDIYFSPADGVSARLLDLIQGAQESIYFLAYSFTSNNIGDAVMAKAQAGIKVAGVMDAGQIVSSQGTEYDRFVQAGLDVRKDGNAGLMHHKVFIIDRKIVVTGSYNFTGSAENINDENVVAIYDPRVAAQFLAEFQRNYARAQLQP